MTALSDPAAALTAVLIVAPLVAGMFCAYDYIKDRWFDTGEDLPDDIDLPSHVHVVPIGEQVIAVFDQDEHRGAA